MALTVDIPLSNSRLSEEDRFVSYILNGFDENGEKKFLHYGAGWSDWEEGYSDGPAHKFTPISHDAYANVIEALRGRGYSILRGHQIAAGTYMIIRK